MHKPRGFFRWKRRLWKSFHTTKLQGWSPRFEGMLQLRLYTPDSMMYIVCVYPVYTYHMYIYNHNVYIYIIYRYNTTIYMVGLLWNPEFPLHISRLAKKNGGIFYWGRRQMHNWPTISSFPTWLVKPWNSFERPPKLIELQQGGALINKPQPQPFGRENFT